MSAVMPGGMAAQVPAATDTEEALEATLPSPAERLQRSRERIAQWMINADGRTLARRRAAAAIGEDGWSWLGSLRSNPVVQLLTESISSWWANHPLHAYTSLADGIARDAVAPLARRHPRTMVAGAVVVGALIVWSKPWRWLIKPALFTGIVSQLVSHVVAQVPIDSILSTITSFTEEREPAPTADPEVAKATTTAPAAVKESADA